MSGPIQVIPPGLLGYFQLKVAGRNPIDLGEQVVPVLPMFDWYMQANGLDYSQDAGAGSAAAVTLADGVTGFQGFTIAPGRILVPQEEIWWVDRYMVSCSLPNAGDSCYFTCAYRRPLSGVSNSYCVGTPTTPLQGVAGKARIATSFADGFWVPPGSELGFVAHVNETATTLAYAGFVRFSRLPL